MTKTFTDSDYILGVWFVAGSGVDWFCAIWKEDDGWAGHYRFRYESQISDPVINTPFSGLDEKSWYRLVISERKEDAIVKDITDVADEIAQKWDSAVEFVPVRGNGTALLEALDSRPWAFQRRET